MADLIRVGISGKTMKGKMDDADKMFGVEKIENIPNMVVEKLDLNLNMHRPFDFDFTIHGQEINKFISHIEGNNKLKFCSY